MGKIEEIIWRMLRGEATTDDLKSFNIYNIYYIYMSLYELKRRIEKLAEKQSQLCVYLERIDRWIKRIHPLIKNLDVCYGLLKASLIIAEDVSEEIIRKLVAETLSAS